LRASYSEAFVAPTNGPALQHAFGVSHSFDTTFFDPVLGATVTRPAGSITVTSAAIRS